MTGTDPSTRSDGPRMGPDAELTELAEALAAGLAGRTLATAESFTAGLIAQSVASVDGSGEWFLGGVVAYRPEVKQSVLGVEDGPVITESCAVQMARGAAERFGARVALATTGVAGPGPQEGRPPGTAVVGWCIDGATGAVTFDLAGTPDSLVRRGARTALEQLARELAGSADAEPAAAGDEAADRDEDSAAEPPDRTAQPAPGFSREELPRDRGVTVVEGGDLGDGGD